MDKLIPYDNKQLQKVGNAIAVTNKLLALAELQLIPYRKGDKWGFCTADKKIVIDCVYDEVQPFYNGRAIIQEVSRNTVFFSLINTRNIKLTRKNYNELHGYYFGLARVKYNGLYGFINQDGVEIIESKYEQAKDFTSHDYWIQTGEKKIQKYAEVNGTEYIDDLGNPYYSTIFDDLAFNDNDLNQRIRNSSSEFVINSNSGKINYHEHKYGNYNYKYVDEEGYNCIEEHEGLIKIYSYNHKKFGYLNTNAIVVIPFVYDDAKHFSGGCAGFKKGKFWGFIDRNGFEIVPPLFDGVGNFGDGIAPVEKNGKIGYIDYSGNEIIEFKYEHYFGIFKNGLGKVKLNNKLGFINKNGVEFWEDKNKKLKHGNKNERRRNSYWFLTLGNKR